MSSSTRIAGYSLSGASQIAWFIPLPSRSPAPGRGDHSSEDPSPQGDRVSSSVGEPLERSRWVDHQSVLLLALVVIWAARPGSYLFRRIRKAGKDARFDAVKPTTSTPSGASSRRARAPTSWCSARTSRRARPSRSVKARSCSPCSAARRCTRIPTSERRPARLRPAGGSRGTRRPLRADFFEVVGAMIVLLVLIGPVAPVGWLGTRLTQAAAAAGPGS